MITIILLNMKYSHVILSSTIISAILFSPLTLTAASVAPESRFLHYVDITASGIVVPTVLEMSFLRSDFQFHESFLLRDEADKSYLPSLYMTSKEEINWVAMVNSSMNTGNPSSLVDGSYATYAEFGLPIEGTGLAEINLVSSVSTQVSGFTLLLGDSVALPTTVSVSVMQDMGSPSYDMLRDLRPTSAQISFPITEGKYWKISLGYSQPLRILEVRPV